MTLVLTSALAQGLLWSILAIGIYISYRILNISDLTSESSFTLGAAVTAAALIRNVPPVLAICLSVLAGCCAGYITGFLHTKMRIPSLLAGILTMTGLYSINLRVMGKANIPLNQATTILTNLRNLLSFRKDRDAAIILGVIVILLVIAFLVWFLNTEFGFMIVATGINDRMVTANGVNSDRVKTAGLMLANALIALSGSLVSQYNAFADVQMGIGAIVIGLASVIIGEVFLRDKPFIVRLFGVVAGSIIYRLIVAFAINSSLVNANDMKLFTAILVALAIYLTDFTRKRGTKRAESK